MSNTIDDRIKLLNLLVGRLEHLSVDSKWARRASGLRGNIVKVLEEFDSGGKIEAPRLDLLIETAFEILRQAAQELPDPEELLKES